MVNKLLVPALLLAVAGAAQAEGLPGVTDGPGPNLVIEVADTSLRKDLRLKAPLYAEAGIPVYWLVDVNAREVLVMSEPQGGAYQRVERARPGDVLTLADQPAVAVPVAEIVPPS